jgi:hypothetical protein
MPPSRRLNKYKPIPNTIVDGVPFHDPAVKPELAHHRAEYEERLFDENEANMADLRATEMAEDLSLNPTSSRSDRRGSEATVVSHTPTTREFKAPTTIKDDHVAEVDKQIEETFGKRKARKVMEGQYAVEDGKLYDMSLSRAIFSTVKKPWLLCLFFNAMPCEWIGYASEGFH